MSTDPEAASRHAAAGRRAAAERQCRKDSDVDHVRRLALTSLFAALALVLSFVETMIPLPVALPGVKLGLSNVAVLVALYAVDTRCALTVAVVKVVAAGLIFGSPMMIAYSAGGTCLAFIGMLVCKRIPFLSIVVTSMVAAILHNAGQLLVAAAMMQSWAVMISLAPLAVAACITGALTGLIAAAVEPLVQAPPAPPRGEIKPGDLSALALDPGSYVSFIGVNGSGKSSYARALAACDDLGSCLLAVQDADGQIVAQTVRDDVAFGLESRAVAQKEMEGIVDEALAYVGLSGLADEEVERLSGGQKQLVVLAGLAVLLPDVIIFDETTSMMDDESCQAFARVIRGLLKRGTCVVNITQDMDEALCADRVALFVNGGIHAVLTPDELRQDAHALAEVGLPSLAEIEDAQDEGAATVLYRGEQGRLVPSCGEIVGLRGKNGAGKSTALDLLARELGDQVAIVRQRPECQFFSTCAFDEVAFGPRNEGCSDREIEARVERALGIVGIDVEKARTRSPFAYSGGERRRLALACALALERDVLLLDEPTAGLDPVNAQQVWSLIAHLREEGRGLVVVSHDAVMLGRFADRVYVLKAPTGSDIVQDSHRDESAPRSFGAYQERDSFAHGLDPRAKVVFSLLFLLACALSHGVAGMVLIVVAALLQLVASRCTPFDAWRSVRALVPLMVFVAIFDVLFVGGGTPLLSIGSLLITTGGILFAVESVVRFAAALSGASRLMATTRPVQLADALTSFLKPLRSLGVPVDDTSFGLQATFRFIPVLVEEYGRIRQAQADRGATFSQGSLLKRVRSFVPVIVPLFTSIFARVDTLATAILNRGGYGSGQRTCIRVYHMRTSDAITIVLGCLIFGLAIATNFM